MSKYILRRLLQMIPVVLGVAILIFTVMYFVPGDPAVIICGSDATAEQLEATRESLGLNRPYLVRLGSFLFDAIFKLDFGKSYITNVDITTEILRRLPRTLTIGFSSLVLTVIVGVPLGIVAAVNQNRAGDKICMVLALFGVSMPQFWFGLMLVILFSVKLGWLPASGLGGFRNFIMPVVACAIGGIASNARQARSSMLEEIRADYITTARAKGISRRKVIWRHALPNALIPILTGVGGALARVCGGSVVIETVFSIPGIGLYMKDAISNRDYPVIQACVIFLAVIFSLVMLLVDLVYGFVDPKIKARYENSAKGGKKK